MRKIFTLILFLSQIGAIAQVSPDSSVAYVFMADTAAKPTLFVPLVRNLVQAKLREKPSRELKILAKSAIVISGVSAVGAATYAFGDEPLRDFMLTNRTEFTHKVSQYLEPLGRSKYLLWASGGFYGTGLVLRNTKLQRVGLLATSSLMLNNFLTQQLKDEFQRRRPNVAEENHYFEGGEGGRHHGSFPSWHTSTAFTFATSVATVYKDSRWVPPVAYGMATLVGLSRIHDNKHWATDVFAGATVGFFSAKAANFILKQTGKQLQKRKIDMYVSPRASTNAVGLNLGGTF